MYEQQTYEAILQRMLRRVPDDLDAREGSIIYDALAPAAAELAQFYIEMDNQYTLSFADTASGEYLERRTAEFGVQRFPATKAKRWGTFTDSQGAPVSVPLGSRFSINGMYYRVIESRDSGQYILEAERPGSEGNAHYGALLPVDYVEGLAVAQLGEIYAAGEDEESDEALRQRFYEVVNEQPFGGNVSDYKQKLSGFAGVGGVKVYPVWRGGGTVKCTIIGSDFSSPSAELVDEIQSMVDPEVNSGEGLGLAPIGHEVTITGTESVNVSLETKLTLSMDTGVEQIREELEEAVDDYFLSLRESWKDEPYLTVRTSHIEARILSINGIEDVTDTKLNGEQGNVQLGEDEIPILGAVTLLVEDGGA